MKSEKNILIVVIIGLILLNGYLAFTLARVRLAPEIAKLKIMEEK